MGKLKEVAPQVLPFVRSLYARVSQYLWWDDDGRCHEIAQAEGVEQGDSLAPALFALGQHDALATAARQLEAGEFLAAFLDDIYVVTSPSRARDQLDAVTATLEREARVAANLAKREYLMPAGAPRHQAFASSARKFGAATSLPQSAGLLLWACRSATRSSSGRAPATAWKRSAGCWPNCPSSRTCSVPGCCSYCSSGAIAEYARAHDDEVWRTLQGHAGRSNR